MALPTASDNLFPKVQLDMQTSDPSAPSGEDWKLYAKPGGIYARSSNGIVGPFGSGGGSIPTGHGVVAYHNTTQTVNNSIALMNSEVTDSDGYHDTSSNTSRLTVPTGLGGLYIIEFGTLVVSLAAGEFCRIRLNGGSVISSNVGGTNAVTSGYASGHAIYRLAQTDYVELYFTGNRTLGHASAYEAQTHLSLALIGS